MRAYTCQRGPGSEVVGVVVKLEEAMVSFAREREYVGPLFWGAGVPRFGGGVQMNLQAADAQQFRQDPVQRPGEWNATWAWTEASAKARARLRVRFRPSVACTIAQCAVRRFSQELFGSAGPRKVRRQAVPEPARRDGRRRAQADRQGAEQPAAGREGRLVAEAP